MHPIRVVLADDHQAIREGVRAMCAGIDGVEVIAEAADAESAVARVRDLDPDLLVLDLNIPRSGGFAAIRQLKGEGARASVVVLTRFRETPFVIEALACGASAYVLKQSPLTELQNAVTQVARGDLYIDRHLGSAAGAFETLVPPHRTSLREREVLRRSALGYCDREIADGLGIVPKTVEVHRANAMRKLALPNRVALVRFAVLQGWLTER